MYQRLARILGQLSIPTGTANTKAAVMDIEILGTAILPNSRAVLLTA
jgi:hypothetical protein